MIDTCFQSPVSMNSALFKDAAFTNAPMYLGRYAALVDDGTLWSR